MAHAPLRSADAIVKVKTKYRCYLWVDEAHSIGALGDNGRGVSEYWGVAPADIDILVRLAWTNCGTASCDV